jgi:transketolase
MNIQELEKKAKEIRRNIVTMLGEAGSGHPGGSLSAADIATALYFSVLRIDPENPSWEERDRFILSKGHACPLLYSVLAGRGYFPREELMTLRKMGSRLQGHPKMGSPPGVEISSGSLGQGLSVANGMALAGKLDKKDYRVYVLLGDGEIEEGQIWEAAMSAAHYKLDNVCAILDFNGLQIDGPTKEVMDPNPIREKWEAFRWHTVQIDGHNFKEILGAFEEAKGIKGKPTIIIARTTKGKGVSFMENVVDFHGVAPTKEEAKKALEDLS